MAENGMADGDISRGCRQGDANAWRHLVRAYTPFVYRIALRMLKEPLEAEDASQEVFINVHRFIERHDPTRPLSPWLARITYNICLKRLSKSRQAARHEKGLGDGESTDKSQESAEFQMETKQRSQQVVSALNRLAAQDRALLVMRYREGFSDSEIAEVTQMPVGTVKSRLFRSRVKLKQFLQPFLKEISV